MKKKPRVLLSQCVDCHDHFIAKKQKKSKHTTRATSKSTKGDSKCYSWIQCLT